MAVKANKKPMNVPPSSYRIHATSVSCTMKEKNEEYKKKKIIGNYIAAK